MVHAANAVILREQSVGKNLPTQFPNATARIFHCANYSAWVQHTYFPDYTEFLPKCKPYFSEKIGENDIIQRPDPAKTAFFTKIQKKPLVKRGKSGYSHTAKEISDKEGLS